MKTFKDNAGRSWNVEVNVAAIKRVRPDITVILGGPEVSYETEQQTIVALAEKLF